MRNKIFIFKDYKFVLTFENNNVTDYVTGIFMIYLFIFIIERKIT